jgi:signal-transduction protein with cAMP-binding, CBS, and nucleotidyltransferase domain
MQNYTFLTKPSLYLLLFIFSLTGLKAQDSLDISILTCGRGTAEVYQAYGHTGIRVKDHSANTDIVYNYGMFNFNEDNFLMKFIQGKLLYFVATEDFDSFMYDYQYFGRSVREQMLNLTPAQKNQLVAALENNALEENRYYLYDFIYNNCSTQPRELIKNSIGQDFKFKTLAT